MLLLFSVELQGHPAYPPRDIGSARFGEDFKLMTEIGDYRLPNEFNRKGKTRLPLWRSPPILPSNTMVAPI